METITKQVQVFKASDGTEFMNQHDCAEYENSRNSVIRRMFDAIPQRRVNCYNACAWLSEDNDFIIINPRSINDILILNMAIEYYSYGNNHKTIDPNMVGYDLVFATNCDDEPFYIGTLSEVIDKFANAFGETVDELG